MTVEARPAERPTARAVPRGPAPLVRPYPGAVPRRTGDAAPPSRLARDEPCVERVSAVVARAVVEVLRGWRPPAQLALWTSPLLQHDLERRAPRRPSGPRLQVTRIRVDQPAPDVAEVCALAYDPGCRRLRVFALRLEQRAGSGWTMTRLQAG